MKITDLLKRYSIDLDGQVTSKEETIDHMVSLMVKSGNISDEEMLKEKYKNNVEAIRLLKLCEKQNRYATPEEQKILSKYVGWGGLKSVFEEQNDNWSNEYVELKELLTEEEYKNARQSSLTAYYTPPVVIRNIYKALQNMGLKQGNILEPSCRCR